MEGNVDPRHPEAQRAPGGVGDGLPALSSGEPVMARWFVVVMLVLGVVGIGVVVWALTSIESETIPAAERRPPGTSEVTHERGRAALAEDLAREDAGACASGITLVGDEGGRATVQRALEALCPLLDGREYAPLQRGLDQLRNRGGRARVAVFELTGVDASSRVEDGAVVLELNARYQFDRVGAGAPVLAAEIVHAGQGFPGDPIDAAEMLVALQVQDRVCRDLLPTTDDRPSGCRDAAEVLASDDPIGDLVLAGFPAPAAEPA